MNKKLLAETLILVILLIVGWHFFNICDKNSNCQNTCCGCIKINEKCDIHCEFQPQRKCELKNGECVEGNRIVRYIEVIFRCGD